MDTVTWTSRSLYSLTSSQPRDTYVITTGGDKHLTVVYGVLSNSSHDNVVKTISILPAASLTDSGDHVTVSPDVMLSSTGSDVGDGSRSGFSTTNYASDRVTVVAVGLICACAVVLVAVLAIVTAILVR